MTGAHEDLQAQYEAARQAVSEGELGTAVTRYEELVRSATAVGQGSWAARALSDLAALAASEDLETARQLLHAARVLDPTTPTVATNLAALELRSGRPAKARAHARSAVEGWLARDDVAEAATSLDLWLGVREQLGATDDDGFEQLAGRLLVRAREQAPVPPVGESGVADVLVLGDGCSDREKLVARVEACRARGEQAWTVTAGGAEGPGLRHVTLDVELPEEIPAALASEVQPLAFRRIEVVAGQDVFLWAVAALSCGLEVCTDAAPLRRVAADLIRELPGTPLQEIELSVVIPCGGRPDALARLLHSLRCQTLADTRFEVIVVDDGSVPAVQDAVPRDLLEGIQLVRQERRGPAAARNRALQDARGRLVMFLNADALLADDTLERHLAAHQRAGRPVAILGRFDATDNCRTPVVEMCERAGLVFPYPDPSQRGQPLSGQYFWTCNLTVPTAPVREVGGFDETFDKPMCEDVELGLRLARSGVPVLYEPDIACGHDHPLDAEGFARRNRLLGYEWVRVARKHGLEGLPLFERQVLPDESLARTLYQGVLRDEARQHAALVALRRAEQELDSLLRDWPERRAGVLDKIEPDLTTLLRGVLVQEVRRGVISAIEGATLDDIGRSQDVLRRVAAVFVLADASGADTIREILESLPASHQLIVVDGPDLPQCRVPRDGRVVRLRGGTTSLTQVRRRLLEATDAGMLVFLDGTRIPSATEWDELRLLLGATPGVGAVGLDVGEGIEHALGQLVDSIPTAVVATRRTIVEADDADGGGSFLERIRAQGARLVRLVPSGVGAGREALHAGAEAVP